MNTPEIDYHAYLATMTAELETAIEAHPDDIPDVEASLNAAALLRTQVELWRDSGSPDDFAGIAFAVQMYVTALERPALFHRAFALVRAGHAAEAWILLARPDLTTH